jgi:hypothetical protein
MKVNRNRGGFVTRGSRSKGFTVCDIQKFGEDLHIICIRRLVHQHADVCAACKEVQKKEKEKSIVRVMVSSVLLLP